MKQVLIVDDDLSITDGLMALFELESIDANGAYDREGAERMIEAEFYPVILADLRLRTEEEGFKLIDSIRRLSPRSKIASLTGYATPEVEAALLDRGAATVLRKPMGSDEIIAVITEMLSAIEAEAAAMEARTETVNLEQLYVDVRKVLYSIPQRRYGLTSEETEELVQEAWLLYLEKRQHVQMARAWLAGTIVNLAKQQIHRSLKRRTTTRELTEIDSEEMFQETSSEIDRMMVTQALARVDERTRKLCTLIAMEGWSYEEVSAEMGLPIGSVGPLYIRAKAKLRRAVLNEN